METVLTANSSAGYRQVTLKVDNPYHSDYANLTTTSLEMPGVAIAVLAGSVLVPLLVGSVVSIDGYTGSGSSDVLDSSPRSALGSTHRHVADPPAVPPFIPSFAVSSRHGHDGNGSRSGANPAG